MDMKQHLTEFCATSKNEATTVHSGAGVFVWRQCTHRELNGGGGGSIIHKSVLEPLLKHARVSLRPFVVAWMALHRFFIIVKKDYLQSICGLVFRSKASSQIFFSRFGMNVMDRANFFRLYRSDIADGTRVHFV